jgi:hypothetical protein
MRTGFLVLLVSSCALGGASFAFDTKGATAPPPRVVSAKIPALERIAVIGASMSAGFRIDGNPDMFAKPTIDLAKIVEASLTVKHEPVVDGANGAFFADSNSAGEKAMKALAAAKPTLVVALDYLFWFGYGEKKEEQRMPELEAALAGLAKFECPILIGDLPDMTIASTTPDPILGQPMLTKAMLPKADTLKKLNEKIAEFAKAHANVVIVPLADLTAKLQADGEITIRANKYPKGSIDKLMQGDRLHTTLEGTCAVWVVALDTWLSKAKDVPAASFELDVAKLAAKVGGTKKEAAPAAVPAGAGPEKKPAK